MLKILCVCGCGLGSSFAIEMSARAVLKKLEIEADIDHTTISEASAFKSDIILTQKTFADILNADASEEEKKRVIILHRLTDMNSLIDFIVKDLLGQASILVAFIAMLGLLLQKKSIGKVAEGTFKTLLGFLIMMAGINIIVGALTYLNSIFTQGFGMTGYITDVAAIAGLANRELGSEVALTLMVYHHCAHYSVQIHLPDRPGIAVDGHHRGSDRLQGRADRHAADSDRRHIRRRDGGFDACAGPAGGAQNHRFGRCGLGALLHHRLSGTGCRRQGSR